MPSVSSVAALQVAAASAAPGIRYGIQDDAWLLHGPGTLDRRLDFVQSLGVTTVRFGIHWDQIAPTRPARALASNDPAYRWSSTDAILQGLRARRIEPLVTLYGTASWANGGRKPNVVPTSSTTFADFAYASAKRYPFVRKWTVWNEPNQRLFLANTSPSLYVSGCSIPPTRRFIVRTGGRSSPAASPRRVETPAAYGPLAWVRGMAAAHAKLDAYAHNPYATRPLESPFRGACPYCDVISMSNLNRLTERCAATSATSRSG